MTQCNQENTTLTQQIMIVLNFLGFEKNNIVAIKKNILKQYHHSFNALFNRGYTL